MGSNAEAPSPLHSRYRCEKYNTDGCSLKMPPRMPAGLNSGRHTWTGMVDPWTLPIPTQAPSPPTNHVEW